MSIGSAYRVWTETEEVSPSKPGPYYGVSASDKDLGWHFGIVVDKHGFNVLGRLVEGGILEAAKIAKQLNTGTDDG